MEAAKAPEPMFPLDLEDAPRITLAEREWAIVKPAPKQARKVVPALMKLLPLLGKLLAAETRGPDGKSAINADVMLNAMSSIDEESYDRLVTCMFWSLKRGYPQLAEAEFDNMPVDLHEMLNALPTVMRQVGFLKFKPAGASPGQESAPGEAPAIAPSTGIS